MTSQCWKETTRNSQSKGFFSASWRRLLVRGVVSAVGWPISSKRTVDNVEQVLQACLSQESLPYSPDLKLEELWTKIHTQAVNNKPLPQPGECELWFLDQCDDYTIKCSGCNRAFRKAGNPPLPPNNLCLWLLESANSVEMEWNAPLEAKTYIFTSIRHAC